jgi:hypothetical protein
MAVITGPQRNSLSVEVGGSADHEGVRLDFGGEAAPLADDVAIKLLAVFAMDPHSDDLSRVLVDLVVLLRSTADQAQTEFDPVAQSMWRGHVQVGQPVVRYCLGDERDVAGQLSHVRDRANHGASLDRAVVVELHG